MKKLLVIFISLFTISLFAESGDVTQILGRMQYEIRQKGTELCEENGYRYLILKSYKDLSENGFTFDCDCQDMGDEVFTGTHSYEDQEGKEIELSYIFVASNKKPNFPSFDVREHTTMLSFYAQNMARPQESLVNYISTVEGLEEHIASSDKPLLLNFSSPKCQPCLTFVPYYENYSNQLAEQFNFVMVNTTVSKELCEKFDIQGVPTMVVLDSEGNEEEKLVHLGLIGIFFEDQFAENIAECENGICPISE